eukprot:TRINITY_DN2374_c0_g1_i1.p1 TRINITY_DN2374_c0_g1~~TRINITY_DN2374_c0_g1_i1.p1  ORF type:complete len:206 (-),score=44.63 TRINITY_DN2374_c0_g1_i1:201-818(-)
MAEQPPDEAMAASVPLPPSSPGAGGFSMFETLPARADRMPAVVRPPSQMPGVPEPEEEFLPEDEENDGWLELLRDGHCRQLREENECDEPPIFHRAMHFAAEPGQSCPKGRFPRASLMSQLKLLLQLRAGGDTPGTSMPKLGAITQEMLRARQVPPPSSRQARPPMMSSPVMQQPPPPTSMVSLAGKGITVAPPAHMGVNRTIVK